MQIRFLGLAALIGVAGCYQQYTSPEYPVSYGWSAQAQPVQGPPGGGMDYAEEQPAAADPGGAPANSSYYASPTEDGAAYAPEAPAATDPVDGGAAPGMTDETATAPVTDAEINATLGAQGTWFEDPEYGRVWRPDTTVVGVDFTPYETCGSWVWTLQGWTFNSCYDWGWLPFHYGQWAYFDSYGWGWCPGYDYSPAWVDWRDGGGYVGWRPTRPRVRDHRNGVRDHGTVRDHRRFDDSQWRFVKRDDLGRPNVRAHTYRNLAEGLRVTTPVVRPTHTLSTGQVRTAAVMNKRFSRGGSVTAGHYGPSPRPAVQPSRPVRPGAYTPPSRTGTYTYQPPSRTGTYQPPSRTHQPSGTYGQQPPRGGAFGHQPPPSRTYGTQQPPSRTGTYQPPSRTGTYQPPSRTGAYQPPSPGTYQPPSRTGTYQPPSRTYGTQQPPSRTGAYQPQPSRTYGTQPQPPSRTGTYQPPSAGTRHQPAPGRTYGTQQPPSRSYGHSAPSRSAPASTGSRSYSAPSRSSAPAASSRPSSSAPRASSSSSGSSSRASSSSSSSSSKSSSSGSSRSSSSSSGGSRGGRR